MKSSICISITLAFWLSLPGATNSQTTIDFDGFAGGVLLTNQLQAQGVTFPDQLIISRCLNEPMDNNNTCDVARSSPNVVVSPFLTEFRKSPIVMEFTALQRIVSLYVNGESQNGSEFTSTIQAFAADGSLVGSQTKTFISGVTWTTQLRIENASANISRIVVTGGETFAPDNNFLLVDDLYFEGEAPPPPPVDTTPPTVLVLDPSAGATVAGPDVDITIRATDDQELQTVDLQLEYLPTGAIIWRFSGGNICGTGATGTCPATFVQTTLPFHLTAAGEYEVHVRATDAAGNSAELRSRFNVEQPALVRASKVEFNTGTEIRLDDPFISLSTPVSAIPGKELVIRYYLLAEGAPRSNYTAQLIIVVEKVDGSRIRQTILPNAGRTHIDVPQDPGDSASLRDLQLQQRADLNQTLNFVIPGNYLTDASFVELKLWDSPRNLSVVQIRNLGNRASLLGLNIVRVRSRETGPSVPKSQIRNSVIAYLKAAYPVSDVQVLSWVSMRWGGEYLFADDCESLLFDVWWEYGGDDAPRRFRTSIPHYAVTLGVARRLDSCGGIAFIGDPDDDDDRVGGTAITTPFGDIAAQEVAHAMGLVHAGNDHGEAGGGDWERWPYPHGRIGEGNINFGTIVQQETAPGPGNAGEWRITLVDPCPTTDISQRIPDCLLPDNQTPHDFMSYGSSNTFLGALITSKNRWVSDRTYSRISKAIFDRRLSAPVLLPSANTPVTELSSTENDTTRQETLMIAGIIDDDRTVHLLPMMRKLLRRSLSQKSRPGPYRLDILDGSGQAIYSKPFALQRSSSTKKMIRLHVPYFPQMKAMVIRDDNGVIYEQNASAHAPTVRVLYPNGGETLRAGTQIVKWEGSDADGDELTYLVQYSPDNGLRWQGAALVRPGQPTKVEIEVEEFIPSNAAIIRVTASDGFNTTEDRSDKIFSLGKASQNTVVAAQVRCSQTLSKGCVVTIPVVIDVTETSPAELLGSFSGKIMWDPTMLKYASNSGLLAGFTGIVNEVNTAQGELIFNGANANGSGGTTEFLQVKFEVVGQIGDSSTASLAFSAMSAAFTFTNLLPQLAVDNCEYRIVEANLLGDVNDDGLVNSTDALIILSSDVGLPIPEQFLARINNGVGDVNGDGLTNSTDALIVLSFDVGIEVPFALGERFCP